MLGPDSSKVPGKFPGKEIKDKEDDATLPYSPVEVC